MTTFTLFHVLLSLVGIATGFVVLYGLITAKRLDRWTAVFFVTTVATSVTGFMFPFHKLLPSHIIGIISLSHWLSRYGRATAAISRALGVGSTL
jgi:hypothetical protein